MVGLLIMAIRILWLASSFWTGASSGAPIKIEQSLCQKLKKRKAPKNRAFGYRPVLGLCRGGADGAAMH